MSTLDPKKNEAWPLSVVRMIRFCYFVQMGKEYSPYGRSEALPFDLTRSGTLIFQNASFLYSLFEDRNDSINVFKIWEGFDHPFEQELQDFEIKLAPFKEELKQVRNRIGFHGDLSIDRQRDGVGIFDVDSDRGREFMKVLIAMRDLAVKMIEWSWNGTNATPQTVKWWQEFLTEMTAYKVIRQ